MLKQINWGIIGCGDVTEKKSGPAFSRIEGSRIVAVMRRSAEKAEDYARRHGVPRWYADAGELLNDPEVNAVYVATPPGSHARYAVMAAEAGKHVYVEKPMAMNLAECEKMIGTANKAGVSLFVAYYRRALPYFLKIKELLDSGAVGSPRLVNVRLFKPGPAEKLDRENLPWRFRPEISGGGLFVDLASHQLDFLDFFFGPVIDVKGLAANQGGFYPVEDIVSASFRFESGVLGTGIWCFTAADNARADIVEIVGEKGKITFSTFSFAPILLETGGDVETFEYTRPEPIQEAFIRTMVNCLTRRGPCDSTGISGARTTRVMDKILKNYYR